MEEDNRANVGILDDYLMLFLTNRMTYNMDVHTLPHSSWHYAVAIIVATVAMVAKHLTISGAIL
jgi:hypothetical protein